MLESQLSSVHGLASLQLGVSPPIHTPPEQLSAVVHASPSSHGARLLVCVHPVSGVQASSVHELPSSQLVGGPPLHNPFAHWSPVVHALSSSQGLALWA